MEKLITIEEALVIISSACKRHQTTNIELMDALGNTLASDVIARYDMPKFDRAMLDGYAVNYEDIKFATREQPATLVVPATVPAGLVPSRPLRRGEAFRTMTGAPMAEGADTLVRIEYTESSDVQENRKVDIYHTVPFGEAVQKKADDIREGEMLLSAGTRIGPKEIALLATQGINRITVVSQPSVGIYSTGSEVVDFDQPLQYGQVYNSNTPMLSALIQSVGAEPYPGRALKDDSELMKRELSNALLKYDVIVTTGGVSVGDFDLVPRVFEELGVKRLFWGVYMRPGTPAFVGTYGSKLVFALSGNPPATYVNAHVLLLPALRLLLGQTDYKNREFPARLYRAPNKKKVKHTRFLTGKLFLHEHEWWIDVGGNQSTGSLTRFVDANALARIEPGDELGEGQYVQVELLNEI